MNAAHDDLHGQPTRAPRLELPFKPLPAAFEDALCVTIGDPALWDLFVDGETRAEMLRRRSFAAEICQFCPVRRLCVETALADPTAAGVWGGRLFNPKSGLEEADFDQAGDAPCGGVSQKTA